LTNNIKHVFSEKIDINFEKEKCRWDNKKKKDISFKFGKLCNVSQDALYCNFYEKVIGIYVNSIIFMQSSITIHKFMHNFHSWLNLKQLNDSSFTIIMLRELKSLKLGPLYSKLHSKIHTWKSSFYLPNICNI